MTKVSVAFRFLQVILIISSIAGLVGFVSGIGSVHYSSMSGWTVYRLEGFRRLVPLFLSILCFSWYLLNKNRNPVGFWIGVAFAWMSILWNFVYVFIAFFETDFGLGISLLFAFAQLVKTGIIYFIFRKLWVPMKSLYI